MIPFKSDAAEVCKVIKKKKKPTQRPLNPFVYVMKSVQSQLRTWF